VRIEIRVRPGAAFTRVGGAYGEALVVAVATRAVDGRATDAALAAVADAFRVRRRQVRLITGAASRTKIVEIADDEARIRTRLAELRGRRR
jgi:uncharacterized protein